MPKAKPKVKPIASLSEDLTSVKAIADRASETSLASRSKAEANRKAAAHVDLKPLPVPTEPDEYYRHVSAWISGSMDEEAARNRWQAERVTRETLLTQKQCRMLKAGLDGRCNRLRSG